MEKVFLTSALGWLIPGLGHIILERWGRGILLLAGTLSLIVIGTVLGGLYYPGNPAEFGVMYWLHQFSSLGNGIFLILNFFLKQNLQSETAVAAFRSAYFEYGGRCLALAGLLNFLAIIDVVDINLRRKS
jgi:hypothetical protein